MALQKDIIDERFGNTFTNAYIKLAYLRWSDVDNKAIATFSTFATPTARGEGKEAIGCIEIDVTDEFVGLQEKLYNKAKLMDQLSGAIDV